VLRFLFIKEKQTPGLSKNYFYEAYRKLGPATKDQRVVAVIFITTAVLWFTRADIDFGTFVIPGWSGLFGNPAFIQDSTVAVLMAFILFLIPSSGKPGSSLLHWKDVTKLPFDIILLFGSGFALAEGFEVSGLSDWLAAKLRLFQDFPPIMLVLGIAVVVCVISEFASNVASIQLALPILIAFQKELGTDPLLLMVPATLAASLGFMLPVATAPNTIVYGSGRIGVRDMARAGLLMDIAGIIVITLIVSLMK
jgi:sodium-dependent dicarboxylate transporter 2/3/5